MEIALLAGKYLLAILIYVFVWVVYKGLVAQAQADREEEAARLARAELPRMAGRVPAPAARPPVPPAPSALRPVPPPPTPERQAQAAAGAASVRGALAEEETAAPPEVAERPVPALLARELPLEVTAAEAPPEPATPLERPAESVLEALAEPEPPAAPEPAVPLTPAPGAEPGTLVVSSRTPRLVVLHSESPEMAPGREFPLLAAATIGRAAHNLVVLADTFVSSQHALIFLKEGRRVLRDRGSTNGTLVNGHRISGDHVLRDGDQITVGTTVLRYVEPE